MASTHLGTNQAGLGRGLFDKVSTAVSIGAKAAGLAHTAYNVYRVGSSLAPPCARGVNLGVI